MALKVGLSTYVSGGYVNPVRWDLHEAAAGGTVGALIDSHQEAGPHGQIYNFAFTQNIRDINYIVMFYDVPGGIGIGNFVKSHETTPSTSTITGDETVELIVDGPEAYDPISGQSSVVIPQLHDKDFWLIQRSVGPLLQVRTPEFTWDNTTNTLQLTAGTFNPADTYFAKIRAKFIVNPPGTVQAGSAYNDVVFVDSDITLDGTYFGKLLICDGVSNVLTITLPAIVDIPTKIPLFVESIGTNHKYVILKAATGEVIKALTINSNTFIFSRATRGSIINLAGTLFGFTDDVDAKRRGHIEWGNYLSINRLWADGTEYNVIDYPGLKKAIDALPGGSVVTYTQWASSVLIGTETVFPYKGKYAISNDGLKFKVPDWRDMAARALKTSDGSADADRTVQGAGGYQHHNVGPHDHFMFKVSQDDGGSPYASQGHSTGGNLGYSINGSNGVPNAYKTGPGGSGSTTGKNIGQIPMVIL